MKDHLIDLRSDTVTRPGPAMRAAMAAAEVGDDVWGDDPTVNRLQDAVAERAGKEAGLFFPSGTQSNLAALMAHCGRGDEYIVGQLAHTYKYEGGGAAVLELGGSLAGDFGHVVGSYACEPGQPGSAGPCRGYMRAPMMGTAVSSTVTP